MRLKALPLAQNLRWVAPNEHTPRYLERIEPLKTAKGKDSISNSRPFEQGVQLFWLGKHVSNSDAYPTGNSARANSPSSIAKDQTTPALLLTNPHTPRDDTAFDDPHERVLAELLDDIRGVGWTCSHR